MGGACSSSAVVRESLNDEEDDDESEEEMEKGKEGLRLPEARCGLTMPVAIFVTEAKEADVKGTVAVPSIGDTASVEEAADTGGIDMSVSVELDNGGRSGEVGVYGLPGGEWTGDAVVLMLQIGRVCDMSAGEVLLRGGLVDT